MDKYNYCGSCGWSRLAQKRSLGREACRGKHVLDAKHHIEDSSC